MRQELIKEQDNLAFFNSFKRKVDNLNVDEKQKELFYLFYSEVIDKISKPEYTEISTSKAKNKNKVVDENSISTLEQMNLRFQESREDSNRRFESLQKQIEAGQKQMDTRFKENIEYINKKFEENKEYTDKRYEEIQKQMDIRFEYMHKYMDKRFDDVNNRFTDMNKRFNSMQWMMGIGFTLITTVMIIIRFFIEK